MIGRIKQFFANRRVAKFGAVRPYLLASAVAATSAPDAFERERQPVYARLPAGYRLLFSGAPAAPQPTRRASRQPMTAAQAEPIRAWRIAVYSALLAEQAKKDR